jgi:hypothetical protein
MMALTTADQVSIRLVAERLHRVDLAAAYGRRTFAPETDRQRYREIRRAAGRRDLFRTLEAAVQFCPVMVCN